MLGRGRVPPLPLATRDDQLAAVQTPLRPTGHDIGQRLAPMDSVLVAMAPEAYQEPAPLFDSLPYYDNDLEIHPILREKVQHELAVETQKIQQEGLHPRIPPPTELFVVSGSSIVQSVVPSS